MTLEILLGDEIMMEILSWLPVKSLLQLKCVSKWFHSLISHPYFAKLHLQRSRKCDNILFTYQHETLNRPFLVPCALPSLLENHPLPLIGDDLSRGFDLKHDQYEYQVYGTCNGLVYLFASINNSDTDTDTGIFCIWNPATRKTFQDPQCTFVSPKGTVIRKLGLGYHNLTDTYKLVVVLHTTSSENGLESCGVKVRSMSDNNGWRNIQTFPVNPTKGYAFGEYLNSTLNWIAVAHDDDNSSEITFSKLVIVSLDFGKETFTNLLLPKSLDGVYTRDFCFTLFDNLVVKLPRIGVLKDCLNLFLQNRRTHHFSIWQMKEFGDQKSWTQLFNISIQNFQINGNLRPYCTFENDCVLMIYKFNKLFEVPHRFRAAFYDGRNNKVRHSEIPNNLLCIHTENYLQSLVSPRRH